MVEGAGGADEWFEHQRPARRIDLLVVAVFRLRTIAKTYIHKTNKN